MSTNLTTWLLPSPWLMIFAALLAAGTSLARWRLSSGHTAKLSIFQMPLYLWLALVYVFTQFNMLGFHDPEVRTIAVRVVLLLLLLQWSAINLLTIHEQRLWSARVTALLKLVPAAL